MRSRPADSREWRCCLTAAVLVLASACAQKEFSATPPAAAPPARPVLASYREVRPVYREKGIASWYGRELHGRKTASGEVFDMYDLSAAHRTLPFGTVVRVTDNNTLRTVTVRINDRGPFHANRVLELSYGAARELGILARGTAPVDIETVEQGRDSGGLFAVLAAVFTEQESAQLLKDRLSRKFEIITIVPFESNLGMFYRVRVGSYGTEEKAKLIAGKLKLEGLEPLVMQKD